MRIRNTASPARDARGARPRRDRPCRARTTGARTSGYAFGPRSRHDVEEVEQHPVAVVARDVGAAALLPDQDVLGDELVDRLADRADADAEALGQPALGRNRLAGLPFAAGQRVGELPLDVLVERAGQRDAGRRRRSRGARAPSRIGSADPVQSRLMPSDANDIDDLVDFDRAGATIAAYPPCASARRAPPSSPEVPDDSLRAARPQRFGRRRRRRRRQGRHDADRPRSSTRTGRSRCPACRTSRSATRSR